MFGGVSLRMQISELGRQIWAYSILLQGTGGHLHPESATASKVWSRALVFWSTAISKSSFTKKISCTNQLHKPRIKSSSAQFSVLHNTPF